MATITQNSKTEYDTRMFLRAIYDLETFGYLYFPDMLSRGGKPVRLPKWYSEILAEISRRTIAQSPEGIPEKCDGIVLLPRGFGKSTWTLIFKIWNFVNGWRPYTVFFRVNATTSEREITEIMGILENKNHKLCKDYNIKNVVKEADLRKLKWTQGLIQMVSPVTGKISSLEGIGYDKMFRGLKVDSQRPSMVINDDTDDEESLIANPDNALKQEARFAKRVKPLGQDMFYLEVGTTVHVSARIYQHWLQYERGEGSWTFGFKYAALDENGNSTFPDLFTRERLLKIKQDHYETTGAYHTFNTEYMNNPTSDESSMFPAKCWNFYGEGKQYTKQPERSTFNYVVIGVDAAMSTKKTAHFSAATVWARALDGTRHKLARLKGRWDFTDLEKNVIDLYRIWRPNVIAIEDKVSGKSLIQTLRRKGYPVREMKADADKVVRAAPISPLWKNGLVWCANTPNMQEGIEELSLFPNGSYDDEVDADVHANQALTVSKAAIGN